MALAPGGHGRPSRANRPTTGSLHCTTASMRPRTALASVRRAARPRCRDERPSARCPAMGTRRPPGRPANERPARRWAPFRFVAPTTSRRRIPGRRTIGRPRFLDHVTSRVSREEDERGERGRSLPLRARASAQRVRAMWRWEHLRARPTAQPLQGMRRRQHLRAWSKAQQMQRMWQCRHLRAWPSAQQVQRVQRVCRAWYCVGRRRERRCHRGRCDSGEAAGG